MRLSTKEWVEEPLQRRTVAAAVLGAVATMMQGCNETVRPMDVHGTSQLNTSWRVPGEAGYEEASDFCKLPWSYSDTSAWKDIAGSQCGHEGDQSPIHIDYNYAHYHNDNSSKVWDMPWGAQWGQPDDENTLGPPQWFEGDVKLGVQQTPDKHEWTFDIIGGVAGITFKGKNYTLTNFHLHSPAEHTIKDEYGNEIRYPAEMHFVNTAADGEILVVALFYVIDKTDFELSRLAFDIGAVRQGDIPINSTDKMLINNPYHWPLTRYNINTYYTYTGSLTTPPCSTGVTWMVFKQTRMMNLYQLSQYRGAIQSASCDSMPSSGRWINETTGHEAIPPGVTDPKWNISVNAAENNRPTQPLGGRTVYTYTTPTPISLYTIEIIFVTTISWMLFAIRKDRIFKHALRDKSRREWLNSCGLPLPDDLARRLVVVDRHEELYGEYIAIPDPVSDDDDDDVDAREPADQRIVAPLEDMPAGGYQPLQG